MIKRHLRGHNDPAEKHLMVTPTKCDKCGDLVELADMHPMRDGQGKIVMQLPLHRETCKCVCIPCHRDWLEDHT